jgi:hypothetical protein
MKKFKRIPPAPNPTKLWAMWSSRNGWFYVGTGYTRAQLIIDHVSHTGRDWKQCRKDGDRPVRVTLVPAGHPTVAKQDVKINITELERLSTILPPKPPAVNHTLELIKAQKAVSQALHAEKKAKQLANRDRLRQAFEPLMKIWNDAKDLPSKHYRWHSHDIVPLSKHLAREDDESGIQFWNGSGNYGFSVNAHILDGGSIEFRTRCDDQGNYKVCTLEQAIEALVESIALKVILPKDS